MHLGKKCLQVSLERRRQRGGQEPLLKLTFIITMQGEILEVVFAEKLIEHICSQNHCRRYCNPNSRKTARDAERPQEMAHECQAARLAAERPGADSQEA